MRVVGFLALGGQNGDRTVLSVNQSKLWDLSLNKKNVIRTGMRLYPNPANGHTMLETRLTGEKQIVVLSSSGQVVEQFRTRESNLLISTSGLSDGVYYVKCIGGDGVKQVAFIVRH
jgi:hypothetical protein